MSDAHREVSEVKNALLLFCKAPVPGLVKTRLTKGRGGALTDEQAAEFFRRSLLDVSDLAMLALDDLDDPDAQEIFDADLYDDADSAVESRYDFFISTTSEADIELLRAIYAEDGPWPRAINYIIDEGASFDEHFDSAFRQLFERGYDKVVAIGGDMPTLPREHITDAFDWLEYLAESNSEGHAFVMAPCQQSGVSLVAMTRTTPMDAQGVYYNMTGRPALDAYALKLQELDIPCAYLSPVSDVDEDHDLAHAISCLNAIAEATRYQPEIYLARRVLEWIDDLGLRASAPPNENHDPRNYIDS
jgi:glycosyltransferase A (GT-A) superfamily protein (DUF2064 family)